MDSMVSLFLASSRRSVSWEQRDNRRRAKKIKKSAGEEVRERLWANLTNGRSSIPGSGIPSDWSILTDFVNTRALLTQMRYAIWWQSKTFQWVTWVIKSLLNNIVKDFPQLAECLHEEQKNCIKIYMVNGRCICNLSHRLSFNSFHE